MSKSVKHLIRYSAPVKQTDAFTKMYEETWCGLTKTYIKDDVELKPETLKDLRRKMYEAKNPPAVCKKCEKMIKKSRGE